MWQVLDVGICLSGKGGRGGGVANRSFWQEQNPGLLGGWLTTYWFVCCLLDLSTGVLTFTLLSDHGCVRLKVGWS